MRLFQRSFRGSRVTTLVLIPVLALLGLCAFIAATTSGAAITLSKATTSRSTVADPVGLYLTSLQGERFGAVTYLAAPTAQDRSALVTQERKTDKALAAMRAAAASSAFGSAATSSVKAAMAVALREGAGLPAFRQKIMSRAVSRAGAQATYNSMIVDGTNAITATVLQEPEVPLFSQSIAVLQAAGAQDLLLQSQALLVGDLLAGHFPAADHAQFAQLVGAYHGELAQAISAMQPAYAAPYKREVATSSFAALQANENTVINSPPGALHAIHPASYNQAAWTVSGALVKLSFEDAVTLANSLQQAAWPIDLRLIVAGALGLLALVSIVLSALIGRRLVRQLAELRDEALELAHQRLPQAMARLSAGEHVDVDAEAPPLAASKDEIGQVRQAFNSVQRSAIEAAVNQARLRSGISTIFRNVARRSQVLLHQQLSLLDALERRATEPAELEGLFRIDHLTTRMRRHAEGFVVLAGDRPGRTWTEAVPLADVLRGAVAEVVEYARIRVVCVSRAALQGRAVGDVIHLIAELAENATVFSPPHTPVRIVGSVVVRGFAVEIEDRGLGMSPQKMAEINAAFLDPPQPDFPDSQQLGLYVATRLAQRHDIRVTLRSSPFGGTTAILLIPMKLIVADASDGPADRAAWSEGQPGEANSAPTGRHASRATATATDPEAGQPAGLSAGLNGHAKHNGAERRGADTPPDTGSWELPDWMYGDGAGLDKPPAPPEPRVRPEPPAVPSSGPGWPAKSGRFPAGGDGAMDEFNLPRRVRQASIAPQLRDTPSPQAPAGNGKRSTERSPEEIRDGLSALQRGAQRGRGDNASAVKPGAVPADGANQPLDPPEIGGPRGVAT